MNQQLTLNALGTERPALDRLFIAIFPDDPAAADIEQAARQSRMLHVLAGKPLLTERFHVSLFHLGDYVGTPTGVVRSAGEAAALVDVPRFDVTFDYAGSFSGRPGDHPFVLRGSAGLDSLRNFHGHLGRALQRAGLNRWVSSQFEPHVTLLYDDKVVPDHPVVPVSWTVREFVLVHSLLGETRHVHLQRWPLRD